MSVYVRLRQNMEDITPLTDTSEPHSAATPPLCSSGATGILVVAVASLFRLNRLMNGSVALGYARKRVGVVGPRRARGKGGDSLGDRSQGSYAAGSARVAILVLPPLGGTTLVPIPRAGARTQGLLQGLSVTETLVRGLGQTS
jgi:hypothetical protein